MSVPYVHHTECTLHLCVLVTYDNQYNSKLETTWELNSNFLLAQEAAPSQHKVLLYMVTHSRHNPLCVFTLVIR